MKRPIRIPCALALASITACGGDDIVSDPVSGRQQQLSVSLDSIDPAKAPSTATPTVRIKGTGFSRSSDITVGGGAAVITGFATDAMGIQTLTTQFPARPGRLGLVDIQITEAGSPAHPSSPITFRDAFRYYAGTMKFQPQTFVSGFLFSDMVVTDTDLDGIPDYVVVHQGRREIATIKGAGTALPTTTSWSRMDHSGARAVLSADFDDDGVPDLLLVDAASNEVSVYLGDGLGTFGKHAVFDAGQSPDHVAIADMNKDGDLDIVVTTATRSTNNVQIFSRNGGAAYTAVATFTAGGSPGSLAIADLNGDTYPDLLIANEAPMEPSKRGVNSFLRDLRVPPPALSFVSTQLVPAATSSGATPVVSTPTSVLATDIDEDGVLDLAFVSPAARGISVARGEGRGKFAVPQLVSVSAIPTSVLAQDINADGVYDLIVGSTVGDVFIVPGTISPLTFGTAKKWRTGTPGTRLWVGDLDHDSRGEIVVSGYGPGAPPITMLINKSM